MVDMIPFILWVLGVAVGYAFAKAQHHAFMARAWTRLAQSPMSYDDEMGVTHRAEDVMRAFGRDDSVTP